MKSIDEDHSLKEALEYLQVSGLDYSQWLEVGMALKSGGFPCEVWDQWSRNDPRYKAGECAKKWETFKGDQVRPGSIIKMAKEHGWSPAKRPESTPPKAEGTCKSGGQERLKLSQGWDPVQDMKKFVSTLFDSGDFIRYVVETWQNEDGKYLPKKGVYGKTAGQLIESLDKYPDDIAYTVGDYNPEAGAWIALNPLDGQGIKDENVKRYRYALVESDSLPLEEQEHFIRESRIPVATLVYSGGKSLHAIVRVEAGDAAEYRERVAFLYDYLKKQGFAVDTANKNPSRLTRVPGFARGERNQFLLDTNIGLKTWSEWKEWADSSTDSLPLLTSLAEMIKAPPEKAAPLIEGILKRGRKMILTGGSKSGKSWCLLQLAVCISEGLPWLGFQCRKGNVLYVNLELAQDTLYDRLQWIYEVKSLGFAERVETGNLAIWQLRGVALPLEQLKDPLIRRVREAKADLIILDPIYKVNTADENSAGEMGKFCGLLDNVCKQTGAAVVFCHHHSKGFQSGKHSIDRGSGSGVFGRDPDAILDLTELVLPKDEDEGKALDWDSEIQDDYNVSGARAFRLEMNLREYPAPPPKNIWFNPPLHYMDETGGLDGATIHGQKADKKDKRKQRNEAFRAAYDDLADIGETVSVKDMAKMLDLTEKTVRNRVREMDEFAVEDGRVFRKSDRKETKKDSTGEG